MCVVCAYTLVFKLTDRLFFGNYGSLKNLYLQRKNSEQIPVVFFIPTLKKQFPQKAYSLFCKYKTVFEKITNIKLPN